VSNDIDALMNKLAEIKRLLKDARERGGAHTQGFILGLDAGMLLGKIEAEIERREQE
jgi:hypothetical protein